MAEAKLETWLDETRSFAPSPEFSKQANAQPSIYEEAAADPVTWWRREAERLTWHDEPTITLEWDLPFAKWFSDGDLWLLGHIDDVMNISGHRLSTTEVEHALHVVHPAVAEAAIVAFVTL
jgi:acyl-coenzyme A synthetase/AMP-(fatty) acid ligase